MAADPASVRNQGLSRRGFIQITAVAGGVLLGGKVLIDLLDKSLVEVRETRLLMGTVINLAVLADSHASGAAAVETTFTELERQAKIFNHRDPVSPLAVLNRDGRLSRPPQELVEVLSQSVQISEVSGGAFDVTVKPLVDLYRQSQPELPSTDMIDNILGLVDYAQIAISGEEISFSQPGMGITLDGIAKGYIVDAGTAVLRRLGFENVYVEAGGDLMVSGHREEDIPWKIGIQSPREYRSNLMARINLSNRGMATSGDYQQYFSADMRFHHIIDPRLGFSSPELASVTVLSENAMRSDALATAVMVMGVEMGLSLLGNLPGVEGYLVTKSLVEHRTAGI